MNFPSSASFWFSFLTKASLAVGMMSFTTGCCSGVQGDGVTEAACDVIRGAGCAIPASSSECFETYIVRNQDCCGEEYTALMNCFAAAEWHCDDDVAVTDTCGDELDELDACEGDHPLCPHPPTDRPISC